MKGVVTRRVTLASVSAISLVAASGASGAYAATSGDVRVSNTETVQVHMGADGKIDAQRIYEQLVLTGQGSVDVANPVSTKGLRNLDGFGGFEVKDGKVQVKTSVDGTKKFRSVSTFTGELPLKLEITYKLNGKTVKPSQIVGKSGELEVRYKVTNVTGQSQAVEYQNGEGATVSSQENVVIPMVGSLTTVLPSSFTKVRSDEANAAGDGRGGTQLSFTMTLIPPIGSDTAEFGYTAQVKGAKVPKASMSALPVNPLQSPSFKGGAESYKGGAETGQDLTAGATEIDANVMKLRDGAQELVAGIVQLQEGAKKLNAGLANSAAPGAQQLAAGLREAKDGTSKASKGASDLAAGVAKADAGAKKLADGSKELNAGSKALDQGAAKLSNGLAKASAGGPDLIEGVSNLKAGAERINLGLIALKTQVGDGIGTPTPGNLTTLRGGIATALYSIENDLVDGLGDAVTALTGVKSLVSGSGASDTQKGTINTYLDEVIAGLTGGKGKISAELIPGLQAVDAGLESLGQKVAVGVGEPDSMVPGTPPTPDSPSLRNGISQIIGGLGQLEEKGGELADGLSELSQGASELKSGTSRLRGGSGTLADKMDELQAGTARLKSGSVQLKGGAWDLLAGLSKLAAGGDQLSAGIATAADGSSQLAAGLDKAAGSAPALPEGAERLSKEGTSKLIEAGDNTASDYGLKYALVAAGAERASSAQPYGSPEGAVALTAYKFEIAGEDGASSANVKRALAAAVLLAAAGGLATYRRRQAA